MPGIRHITGAAGSAPEGEPGSWVSDAAREKFMAAYERAFALWPQPWEEFDLETATATTRVHAYRPHPCGEPVVLLTGAGYNAASWYPHVAALAGDGPVYGIDMPGDPNPSVPRALMTPPASCAAWLDELLAQLSDRPAHLVGLSYGGWVAMNQAIRAPGRVASITLLDPAGLTSLDARFWLWFSISGLASLTPMPLRRRLARWLDSPSMAEPELTLATRIQGRLRPTPASMPACGDVGCARWLGGSHASGWTAAHSATGTRPGGARSEPSK
jgi:pimeloyl-ACP methyl ester carboxylesterase